MRKVSVLLVGLEPELDDVRAHLCELGLGVVRVDAIADFQGGFPSVCVVSGRQMGEVSRSLAGRSQVEPPPPVLALCPGGGAEELLQALRAGADDALPWPAGRDLVSDRIAALAERGEIEAEGARRRVHAQVLLALASMLDTTVEFEEVLHEALLRLVEVTGASLAEVFVGGEDPGVLFLLGSSDDATVAKLPVPAARAPEAAALLRGGIDAREAGVGTPSASGAVVAAVPLVDDGSCFGALRCEWVDGMSPGEPVQELLRGTGAVLAPRLRASDLYRSLHERTRRVAVVSSEPPSRPTVLHKYEEFFQRAFDGIVVLDGEMKVLYVNPAGEQITGYARDGLVSRSFCDVLVPDDRIVLADVLSGARESRGGQTFDLGLVTTSGDPIRVSVSLSALLTEDEVLVLSFRDVTEARALSEELRTTKEFLERLIDSTVDAIIATDVDGRVVLFNAGAERIFGLQPEEVVGKFAFRDLFPEGTAEYVLEELRSAEGGEVGRMEGSRREILNVDKELVPVSVSASLIYEGGEEVGVVGIISDLRERLRIERRLVQAQEKLLESEKQALIAELAGTTAHELNQPLTSVMGYAELLKKRVAEDDSNRRAIDIILKEAERMAEIVRKIGKITRYETKDYVGSTQILDLDKSSR
ncbi:MAG: PAS domain S-box protein [Deltaproteobacteria bacterium]|nr:PAS domain S-box protein [Deltaproteobacteria bacterium]